jgi:hypothetical protein
MSELPILFQPDMIRALLSGTKGQTRRVIKFGKRLRDPNMLRLSDVDEARPFKAHPDMPDMKTDRVALFMDLESGGPFGRLFDYGRAGDRLWVRESVRAEELADGNDGVRYLADNAWRVIENTEEAAERWVVLYNYRRRRNAIVPSIHMPRWASRLSLELIGTRAERLQDISGADAIAEGLKERSHGVLRCQVFGLDGWPAEHWRMSPVDAYRRLWDSINSKPKPIEGPGHEVTHYISYPWDDIQEGREHRGKPWHIIGNPWVWRIEFKVVM